MGLGSNEVLGVGYSLQAFITLLMLSYLKILTSPDNKKLVSSTSWKVIEFFLFIKLYSQLYTLLYQALCIIKVFPFP